MVDTSFSIDSREDWFFIITAALLVTVFFASTPNLDSQVRFAVSDFQAYMFGNQQDAEVVFTSGGVEKMNTISSGSLGSSPTSGERLYCGSVVNGQVTRFRLADFIEETSLTGVAGSCRNADIFVHSQPAGSQQLSEEDRDLESQGVSFTCVQFDKVVESPVSGEVSGINCWDINKQGATSFEMVEVGVKK